MTHLGRAENYEEEQATDEDEDGAFEDRHGSGNALISTDTYIESLCSPHPLNSPLTDFAAGIVGASSIDDTNSDVEITDIKPSAKAHGKRKAGERLEWDVDDDDEDAYTKFKNRKAAQRKKTAATKKRLDSRAKDAMISKKKSKQNGEESRKEKTWGDVSDYDEVDESIPDYIHKRRKDFDDNYHKMHESGLRLAPRYDDIDFSDDERIADLKERPEFSVEQSRPYKDIKLPHSGGVIPASIAQYLRDYQVEGVAFLHELFVYQKGGILGDDMGLGKTVQVAAFLTAAFGKTGDERDDKRMRKMRRNPNKPWYPRVLIICPGSLIENWRNEFARWGFWHVDKFHGAATDKASVLQTATSGRLEVVITTYSTYRNAREDINLIKWDCVVADECHQIKERKSAITEAMNQVNALCRIGLTGTAIQNKYEELWTLLNWTNPGRFGPLSTWVSSISKPLQIGQS
jgi:SNF2 family DNA or RNA helicase